MVMNAELVRNLSLIFDCTTWPYAWRFEAKLLEYLNVSGNGVPQEYKTRALPLHYSARYKIRGCCTVQQTF
jgi:hypothetical protein